MSTKQTEALKLALEALERLKRAFFKNAPDGVEEWESEWVVPAMNAITAIREALAEQPAQQQDPVAWRYKIVDCFGRPVWTLKTPKTDTRVLESEPLYTSPQPAQQEPVAEVAGRAGDLHIRFLPSGHSLQLGDKLYTSPPASKPWVGLTDEERGQVYANWRFNGSGSSNLELCRAIEAKLREKNA